MEPVSRVGEKKSKNLFFVAKTKTEKKKKKEKEKKLSFLSNRRHLPVLDPRRLRVPRALPEVGLVLRIAPLEPDNLGIALEGEDVRREAVEEPLMSFFSFFSR